MNYKKLIYYRLRDERALIFLFSIMLTSILIGTIIKNIIDLKGIIVILFVFIALIVRYFYKKHSFNKIYQELSYEEKAKLDDDLNKTYFFLVVIMLYRVNILSTLNIQKLLSIVQF